MDEQHIKSEIKDLLKEWAYNIEKVNQLTELDPFLTKIKSIHNYYFRLTDKRWNLLTKREYEIITAVCEGKTSTQIADQLFISKHTVNSHRSNIYKKLSTRKIQDLILFADMAGLI